jgi:hypothetical protein
VSGERLDCCRCLGQLAGALDRAPLMVFRGTDRSWLLPVGSDAEDAQETRRRLTTLWLFSAVMEICSQPSAASMRMT